MHCSPPFRPFPSHLWLLPWCPKMSGKIANNKVRSVFQNVFSLKKRHYDVLLKPKSSAPGQSSGISRKFSNCKIQGTYISAFNLYNINSSTRKHVSKKNNSPANRSLLSVIHAWWPIATYHPATTKAFNQSDRIIALQNQNATRYYLSAAQHVANQRTHFLTSENFPNSSSIDMGCTGTLATLGCCGDRREEIEWVIIC